MRDVQCSTLKTNKTKLWTYLCPDASLLCGMSSVQVGLFLGALWKWRERGGTGHKSDLIPPARMQTVVCAKLGRQFSQEDPLSVDVTGFRLSPRAHAFSWLAGAGARLELANQCCIGAVRSVLPAAVSVSFQRNPPLTQTPQINNQFKEVSPHWILLTLIGVGPKMAVRPPRFKVTVTPGRHPPCLCPSSHQTVVSVAAVLWVLVLVVLVILSSLLTIWCKMTRTMLSHRGLDSKA